MDVRIYKDSIFLRHGPFETRIMPQQVLPGKDLALAGQEEGRVAGQELGLGGHEQEKGVRDGGFRGFLAPAVPQPPVAERVVDDHGAFLPERRVKTIDLDGERLGPDGFRQSFAPEWQPALGVDDVRGNQGCRKLSHDFARDRGFAR